MSCRANRETTIKSSVSRKYESITFYPVVFGTFWTIDKRPFLNLVSHTEHVPRQQCTADWATCYVRVRRSVPIGNRINAGLVYYAYFFQSKKRRFSVRSLKYGKRWKLFFSKYSFICFREGLESRSRRKGVAIDLLTTSVVIDRYVYEVDMFFNQIFIFIGRLILPGRRATAVVGYQSMPTNEKGMICKTRCTAYDDENDYLSSNIYIYIVKIEIRKGFCQKKKK